jgi:hypothetical protein
MTQRPSVRRWGLLAAVAFLLMAAGPPNNDFVMIDIPDAPQTYGVGIDNHGLVTAYTLTPHSIRMGFSLSMEW